MQFPGAQASRAEAAYAIIGAPLDRSTTFQPGTRFGPDRIRQFAHSFEDYDHRTDSRLSEQGIYDHGNCQPWDPVDGYLDELAGIIDDLATDGVVPITLGGEHTVSLGALRALEPRTIISLDAHLDLRDSFGGSTFSHACVLRRGLEIDSVEQVYVLGARTGSEAEWDRADAADVTVIPPADVETWTPPSLDSAYLTLDIDVADPSVAPGTGTMEPFGLGSRTIRSVVRDLAPVVDGMDLVEVNDRDDGQAATLAAKLLTEFVFSRAAGD